MEDIVQTRPDREAPGRRAQQTDNFLLQNLSAADFALIEPHLERVPFRIGEALARPGAPIDTIFFPEGAIAAVLDVLEGDHRLAIGLVGQEGFVGWPLLLGDDTWPHDVVMRAEHGDVIRLSATALHEAMAQSETLRRTLLRFVNVFVLQMGRTIVSSLAHPVERRMARWILLYHDRVRADEICMTHEEFRLMLGVRRSTVTEALHRLEEEGAVRTGRGKVIVTDRSRLVDLAGDTYGRAEREYRRLIIGNAT